MPFPSDPLSGSVHWDFVKVCESKRERKGPKRRWFIHFRDDKNITFSLFIQKFSLFLYPCTCTLCVCMCACMYGCTYVHVCETVSPDVHQCVCVQRPEVESGCCSLLLSTLVRWSGWPVGSGIPCLCFPYTGITGTSCPAWHFTWVMSRITQVLMPMQQALFSLKFLLISTLVPSKARVLWMYSQGWVKLIRIQTLLSTGRQFTCGTSSGMLL